MTFPNIPPPQHDPLWMKAEHDRRVDRLSKGNATTSTSNIRGEIWYLLGLFVRPWRWFRSGS